MKKLFYYFLILHGLFYSCDTQKYVITENGTMNAVYGHNDTIRNQLELEIQFKTLLLGYQVDLIPKAQAFKKEYIPNFLNAIDLHSLVLSADKEITYNSKIVPTHTKIPGYKIRDKYYYSRITENEKWLYESDFYITFPEEELEKLKFQKGNTVFVLTGKNSDNINFRIEKQFYLDL